MTCASPPGEAFVFDAEAFLFFDVFTVFTASFGWFAPQES
jgi:hypothetical protein